MAIEAQISAKNIELNTETKNENQTKTFINER